MLGSQDSQKQKPGLNIGLQNVRDYFTPDLALEDIKWEAFGTPDWAPDRMEMWPTDYVSLILSGRSMQQAELSAKFSGEAKQGNATPNAARPWLPSLLKTTMQRIVDMKPIPPGIRCRDFPPSSGARYQSGFSCTDGEYVLYFLLIDSPRN